MKNLFKLTVAVFFITLISSCGNETKKQKIKNKVTDIAGNLIIFHAGSLSVPLSQIVKSFNKEYSDIKILSEAAGSVECARKISGLKKPCDVFISSDVNVIDNLLIPNFADWSIKFATNEMVIAYNEKSRKSADINKNNWYEILFNNKVAFGRADPDVDPCGYRTVLTVKLAEKYYDIKGLADKLINKDVKHIRPKEVDLLAMLESNSIDYIFIYRSVAEQHKLKYIILPDEINLKNYKFDSLYSTVSVELTGSRPGKKRVQKGEAMVYGITIPNNAINIKAALVFTEFFLDKTKGMKIITKNGQPSIVPSYSPWYDKIPETLKQFVYKDKK